MRRSFLDWLAFLLTLGVFPLLLAGPRLSVPTGDKAEVQPKRQVELWIEDLGSDRFEKREAATHALMNLEFEPSELLKGLKSPDLEVRRRVAHILEAHLQKRVQRGLKRACILAKEGRADEMVERMVLLREWNTEGKEWRTLSEFAVGLVEWEHRTFGNTCFLSNGSHTPIPLVYRRKNSSPQDDVTTKELAEMWTRVPHYVGREFDLSMDDLAHNYIVILASETVHNSRLLGSIIITCGSIRLQSRPAHSIIICDDDLEVSSGIQNCLVIVRGKVTCNKNSKVTDSTILSGGSVSFSESVTIENAAILSGGPIDCPKGVTVGKRSVLRASIPEWPVKFFNVEDSGLIVWQVYRNNGVLWRGPLVALPDNIHFNDPHAHSDPRAGVEIRKVRKETRFASGLREGDIITAIDGKKTPTKDLFRKVLRRRLADGGPVLTFCVQRSGKTLDVSIPVKD